LGLKLLLRFLQRHPVIGIDTSVFIYAIEGNPRYAEISGQILDWLEQPGHAAVTSTLTMTECLVQPYRDNDERRVNEYFAPLSTYPNLQWIAPNLEISDRAAQIRARFRLRTPDALQAATALLAQASGFVSNDAAFERVEGFEALIIEELLNAGT